MEWIPLPIGVENFEDLREHGYYFVDKTLFIKELLDMKGKVNLFTRPRRFGKTLNMSILRYFFEKGEKDHGRGRKISIPYGKISGDQHFSEIHEAVFV